MKGNPYLPIVTVSTHCDTQALSLESPAEAFVAFEKSALFADYLESEGWEKLDESLALEPDLNLQRADVRRAEACCGTAPFKQFVFELQKL